jgi:hypothetical protein
VGAELLAILCDAFQDGKSTASSVQPRTYKLVSLVHLSFHCILQYSAYLVLYIYSQHLGSLADHTVITVGNWDTTLRLKVSGTLESVAEITEAIAWLSAALRSSSEDQGILSISPVVANICVQTETPGSTSLSCEIAFHTEVEAVGSELNGQCWHNLFRNPVVVKGYPIMRKPAGDTGIEMPLDIIAALAHANRITTFLGRTFIKGFSTMLLLTGMIGDVFIWHLLSNGSGERISYTDPRVYKAIGENQLQTDLSMTLLEPSRHLIGWCSTITTSIGM